jgi:hypothetical protein
MSFASVGGMKERLLKALRELDLKARAELATELLEVAQVTFAEIECSSPGLLCSLRCAEFCAECPFLRLSDK